MIAIDRSSNSEPDLEYYWPCDLGLYWFLKRMAERDLICVQQIKRENRVTPVIASDSDSAYGNLQVKERPLKEQEIEISLIKGQLPVSY